MGKTKTSFVAGSETLEKDSKKSSLDAYKAKKEKQKLEAEGKEEKVKVSGLKGGQKIKVVEVEIPQEVATEEAPSEEVKREDKVEAVKAPKVRTKNYQSSKSKVEAGKLYSVKDAVKLVKETSYSKFDGTVELHLVVKKPGISAQVTLPFSGGKEKKIEVATEATIKKLQTGKVDFDILLATPDMMPKLVAFARILGPKGLMPNPKNGTMIKTAKDAEKYSANAINLKTEKEAPLMHMAIGKVSQKETEIEANMEAVLKALGGSKQVVKAYTKATMGPAIKLQII
ncbi:MAG: hypothetical protein ACHQUA_02480 [Microgenomates group bacterium]